jgi:predicted metal-dependent hydrolase
MPDDLALAPAEALALAQRLLDGGRAFHAHEVLEAAWKAAPAAERELWRGLAQIAVGLTHAQRGNAAGAAALLRRGGLRVAEYTGHAPHGIDAAQVSGQALSLANQISAAGLPTGDVGFRLAG